MPRVNQRLNGLDPLSYVGVNAYQPNDLITKNRDPLTSDYHNFYLGTWWLNTDTNSLFFLAELSGGVANWVNISSSSGAVDTLTANSGGPVGATAGNIDVLGDGSTISVVGNPGTNALTVSVSSAGIINTLTGNSGGAVSPTLGNINVVGSGSISVTGNPGTSTLTISNAGSAATSFVTQSGSATPAAGVITINGANGLSTSGSGNTVTITGAGSLSQSFITSPATGTATPAAGVITFAAGTNTTISASGSTITVNNTGGGGGGPAYSTGTFSPTITIATGYSLQFGAYVRIGNLVLMNQAVTTSSVSLQGNINMNTLPFTPGYNVTSAATVMNNAITVNTKATYIWQRYNSAGTGPVFKSLDGSAIVNFNSNNSGSTVSISTTGFYFV